MIGSRYAHAQCGRLAFSSAFLSGVVLLAVAGAVAQVPVDDSDVENRLLEYITNEADVNKSYVVYQRARLSKLDANSNVIGSYETLSRVIRKKDAFRFDQQFSEVDSLEVVRPSFTESSLQIDKRILNFNSLSRGEHDVDPEVDPVTKPGRGMLGKRMDPMKDAISCYGDYLHGPSKDWTARTFGTIEVLAEEDLPKGARRVLIGFPRSGAGAGVITFNGEQKFLPERVEWRISPNAKRAATRPTVEEAMKWSTHDSATVTWKEIDKRFVPIKHEHVHSWAGESNKYTVESVGWSFDINKYEAELDPKTFFASRNTPLDFENISDAFIERK